MPKNKLLRVFSISGIFTLYTYISILISIPENITMVEGTTYNTKFNTVSTVDLVENSVLTVNKDEVLSNNIGKTALSVKLFGRIPIKTVSVNVVADSLVIPGGNTIGVRINTKGLTIIATEGFISNSNEFVQPYEVCNIERGDVILRINGIEIDSVNSFIEHVQSSNGANVELTILKNGRERNIEIKPEKDLSDNKYKLGLWVKEVTSGIGTVTFIDPDTKMFAALGHGINDSDGNLLKIRDGKVYESTILSVIKGKKGTPGELKGAVKEGAKIGLIEKNTTCGIYGKLDGIVELPRERINVALMQDIEIGSATILTNVSGNKKEEYAIEIEKVNRQNSSANKCMVIKITDERLLDKTGGIVQGMSGSPIIQNGKIIGAVTHVLINDPTRGYGIFIENMLKEVS